MKHADYNTSLIFRVGPTGRNGHKLSLICRTEREDMLPLLCTSCFLFLPFSYLLHAPQMTGLLQELKMWEDTLSEKKVKFGNNVERR